MKLRLKGNFTPSFLERVEKDHELSEDGFLIAATPKDIEPPCACPMTTPREGVVTLAGELSLDRVTPTAEHAFGLLWAVQRHGARAVRATSWDRESFLADKMWSRMRFHVVGKGRVGSMFYSAALGFGMRPSVKEDADVISLHADRNPTSEGMIDEEWMADLNGAWLINTAFGEMVNEEAILRALHIGKLKGYAADVLAGEYDPEFVPWRNRLMRASLEDPRIVLTPHIGGSTLDAREATQHAILDKLENENRDPGP